MNSVSIDFETRSVVNLKSAGVYRYAEDPSTDLWCMAYSKGDLEPNIWVPGDPFPSDLLYWIEAGHPLRAWNAQFERIIWNTVGVERYGFPTLPRERFFCSMADALAMGLPGSLERAALALGLDVEKDMAGRKLALQMSKPRRFDKGEPVWWDEDEKKEHLFSYCMQDVVVERTVALHTRRLDISEREAYLLDQKINDRGIKLDANLVRRARDVAYEGIGRANKAIALHTDGDVTAVTQVGRMQNWLREQGCDIPDLRATTLQEYLKKDLPHEVEQVLIARSEGGKASIAKLDKMLEVMNADGRLHGLLQYHGAATGRWAGRLVQPHNFPRGSVKNPEMFIHPILTGVPYDVLDIYANPIDMVSSLLRHMIVAEPGHKLMAGDYSAIEARVTAWLAGQGDLVEMFDQGIDVYQATADEFNTTRQHGKAVILGAGFGMGWRKFQKMAYDVYGIDLTDEEAKEFIEWYRKRYDCIPKLWKALENAAVNAVHYPGIVFKANRCAFVFKAGHLWMILPSGRALCYPHARLVEKETPWGAMQLAVTAMATNSYTHQWERRDLYGGLLTENAVQAASRDVMLNGMRQLEAEGYKVIFTVHDEVITEVPLEFGSLAQFNTLLTFPPDWALGCPIKAESWEGKRYRKG